MIVKFKEKYQSSDLGNIKKGQKVNFYQCFFNKGFSKKEAKQKEENVVKILLKDNYIETIKKEV